ncbi:STAS domain-containing protein [Kitasatospora fiedleri]|uniref:STAS domain-containing protein n=1 Tax=Kitasatospora fiedleri TaxID=2991545 RepID=UPI00249A68D2|nr:STAS domain-containing protein [Kitasatospora fiedleri]
MIDDEAFTVTVYDSDAGPVLACAGELDLDTAPQLTAALEHALAARPAALHIDLNDVDFISSSGLNVLLHARMDSEAAGCALWLTRPSQAATHLLDITGAGKVFTVTADLPAVR